MSFVDDVATVVAATAGQAVRTAKMLAEIAAEMYPRYGMPLNFGPGKSEALIRWVGKGSQGEKRAAAAEGKSGVVDVPCFLDIGSFICE